MGAYKPDCQKCKKVNTKLCPYFYINNPEILYCNDYKEIKI